MSKADNSGRTMSWYRFVILLIQIVLILICSSCKEKDFILDNIDALTLIDMGDIPSQSIVTQEITITNTAEYPIKISYIGSDCRSCTSATSDLLISPKKTANLLFSLSTIGYEGQVERKLYFVASKERDESGKATFTLNVKANATKPLTKKENFFIGNVEPNSKQKVKLETSKDPNWILSEVIIKIKPNGEQIRYAFEEEDIFELPITVPSTGGTTEWSWEASFSNPVTFQTAKSFGTLNAQVVNPVFKDAELFLGTINKNCDKWCERIFVLKNNRLIINNLKLNSDIEHEMKLLDNSDNSQNSKILIRVKPQSSWPVGVNTLYLNYADASTDNKYFKIPLKILVLPN